MDSLDRRIAGWLTAVCLAVYMLTASPLAPFEGDGGHMLEDAAGLWAQATGQPVTPGRPRFSKYSLGQPLLNLSVVGFWKLSQVQTDPQRRIVAQLGVSLLPAFLSAAAAGLLFAFGRRLGYGRKPSLLAALLLALGTMLWPYSQTLLADLSLGVCLLFALYVMAAEAPSRPGILGLGVILGFTCMLKQTALPVVAVLLACFAGRRMARPAPRTPVADALLLAGPMLVFLMLALWYNQLRFGEFFSTGYGDAGLLVRGVQARDVTEGFNTPLGTGLFGLLLSPGKGVFWYNPILLGGLWFGREFFRRHRQTALPLAGVTGCVLLLHACWWAWHGDWSWGPRFLLAVIPALGLLLLPLSEWVCERSSRGQRVALAALALVSVAIQLPGVLIPVPRAGAGSLALETAVRQPAVAGAEGLRDDSLHSHFVPECSALVIHTRLLWALATGSDPARAYDGWRGLYPGLRPQAPEFLHWNAWPLVSLQLSRGRPAVLPSAVVCGLALLGGISLLQLRRAVKSGDKVQ